MTLSYSVPSRKESFISQKVDDGHHTKGRNPFAILSPKTPTQFFQKKPSDNFSYVVFV